jgi:hypothetical protein
MACEDFYVFGETHIDAKMRIEDITRARARETVTKGGPLPSIQ